MKFRDSLERMAEIYGGIAIFSVEPGSTTYRAGVRAGDVLVAVNGRRVRRLSEYAAARRLRGQLLELLVVRAGRSLTLWADAERANAAATPSASWSESERTSPSPAITALTVTCPWRGAA